MFSKVRIVTVALVIAYALANVSNVQAAASSKVINTCNGINEKCTSCQNIIKNATMAGGTLTIVQVSAQIDVVLKAIVTLFTSIRVGIAVGDISVICVTLKLCVSVILQILVYLQAIIKLSGSSEALVGCFTSLGAVLQLIIQVTAAVSVTTSVLTAFVNLSVLLIITILPQISVLLGLCVNVATNVTAIISVISALLANLKICVTVGVNIVLDLTVLIQGGNSRANQAVSTWGTCCKTLCNTTCDGAGSAVKGIPISATILISLQGLIRLVSGILQLLAILLIGLNLTVKAVILGLVQIVIQLGGSCKTVFTQIKGSASLEVFAIIQIITVAQLCVQVLIG